MHTVDAYPPNAVRGSCFLLGRYQLVAGEKVMDLDVELEDLPPYGRLCISEDAIRSMCGALHWTLLTPELQANHAALVAELDDTRAQLEELMSAMTGIVNLPTVERALSVAARKVAGKESVQEWIDSLPKKVKV